VIAQDGDEDRRDGDDADGITGAVLELKSQRDIAAKPSLGLITWLFEWPS
jgi:hypothetical protein